MDPLAVGIEEAARLVGLSKYTIRAYIRKGRIRAVRVGRRVLVPVVALRELCEKGVDPDLKESEGAAKPRQPGAKRHPTATGEARVEAEVEL